VECSTIFPFRILGQVPLEDVVFGFLVIYAIVIYYEHFWDKGKHELIDTRMKYFIFILMFVFILFFTFYFTKPEFLFIPYYYFWFGFILLFIPAITFLSYFPRLLSKYVKTGVYFFVLFLLFELTALQLGQWSFPDGQFIGMVTLLGYTFPFEELFFWFILFTSSILSYYEFFDDDRK